MVRRCNDDGEAVAEVGEERMLRSKVLVKVLRVVGVVVAILSTLLPALLADEA